MGRRILPLLMAAAAVLGAGCEASVTGPNRPPVAVAGPDRVVDLRATATLDGSASWDPDGDPLTLDWKILARPPAGTADLNPVSDWAVELTPDAIGVWVLGLTADDGALRSERDVVQVRVIQPCQTDLDCDDSNVCTSDRCETGSGCVYEPVAGPCDDGDDCTTGDTCDAGTCAGVLRDADGDGHGDPACGGDDCDDADARAYPGNFEGRGGDPVCSDGVDNDCDGDVDAADPGCLPCTQDSDCDDGEYCNGVETCDLVLDCQPGASVDCNDGVGCTNDTCNDVTDTCDNVADDGLCDDTLWCNGAETCDPALDCQPGTDPCPGQGCDDILDQCVTCTGDPECDDGNLCNGAETCSAGSCQPGSNLSADDYCDGTDLVGCDGAGTETSTVPCALGCNAGGVPQRCFQVDPSNLPWDTLCSGVAPLGIPAGSPVVIDTDIGTITNVASSDIVFSIENQGGQLPDIGVFAFTSIDIQADVVVQGSNALALLACGDASIAVQIDASAVGEAAGPGGWDGGNGTSDGSGYQSGEGLEGHSEGNPFNETGGGGGGFGFVGGDGGDADDELGGAGGQEYGTDELVPLLGGSGGGSGGFLSDLSDEGGGGGGGGGAVQITAGGDLVVTVAGGVHVGGAGGGAGPPEWSAGGGGGAGGAILLEGVTVTVDGTLAANGGGGGGANTTFDDDPCIGGGPDPGQPGPYGYTQAAGGMGCDTGNRDGGPGGAGGYGGAATGAGLQPAEFHVSGGGGGGVGRVRINSASGAATISGVVSPDAASGRFTEATVTTY